MKTSAIMKNTTKEPNYLLDSLKEIAYESALELTDPDTWPNSVELDGFKYPLFQFNLELSRLYVPELEYLLLGEFSEAQRVVRKYHLYALDNFLNMCFNGDLPQIMHNHNSPHTYTPGN